MVDSKTIRHFTLCCDSADLYGWLIQNRGYQHRRLDDLSREVILRVGTQVVSLNFIFQHATRDLFRARTQDLLSKTAGTPDYILYNDAGDPLLCVEDSKTAPVGNAVLQRMDKLLPLLLDQSVECPVKYIGPLHGMDHSMNQLRGWPQSWFHKHFAKHREDIFLLLGEKNDVCPAVMREIEKSITQELQGCPPSRKHISDEELDILHAAMRAGVRTYDGKNFSGKVYKPDGSPAHPVQSTLMVIACLRESLGLAPVRVKAPAAHLAKLRRSKSRRVKKALEKGAVLS